MNARIYQIDDKYIITISDKKGNKRFNCAIAGDVRWEYTRNMFLDLKVKKVIIDRMTDELFANDLENAGMNVERMDK